jgi:small subunit ribosomal protein S21
LLTIRCADRRAHCRRTRAWAQPRAEPLSIAGIYARLGPLAHAPFLAYGKSVVLLCGLRQQSRQHEGNISLQVFVRDNNVDQALRALKKKMQREGIFREMKRRSFYEKPSERAAREKSEAVRRQRKLARKKAQREGLIPAPKKKILPGRGSGQRPGTGADHPRPPGRF